MEMDSYEGLPIDPRTNRANIVLKKKTYGGVPAGAGMREDVILIFEELEEARNTMAQIQALIDEVPEPKVVLGEVFILYNLKGICHGEVVLILRRYRARFSHLYKYKELVSIGIGMDVGINILGKNYK